MTQTTTPKRLVFLGPPGAGKGTQSIKIASEQHLAHISTGDILRSSISNGTSLGLKAQSYMVQGHLVPDEVVIGIIEERIKEKDCELGFLLDGFPRTVVQAQQLDIILEKNKQPLTHILDLIVPDQNLISRIEKRAQEQNRPDDNPEVFKNRLKVYHEQTKPVKDFYALTGRVTEIDGVGSMDDVFNRIKDALK